MQILQSQCHRATVEDGESGLQKAFDALWEHFRSLITDLADGPQAGIHQFHHGEHRYRYLNTNGLWAIEFDDLSKGDAWECFGLLLEDGSVRTGWSRRSIKPETEPLAWIAACCNMTLVSTVNPRVWPDFLSLAVTYSSGSAPIISSDDAQEREALQSEILHLRSLTDAQAQTIRKLKLANQAFQSGANRSSTETEEVLPEPDYSMADIEQWASDNADRITVLPRAIAETKKSDYSNPRLFYQALELLAETYRQVKLGELPRETLKSKALELNLDIGGSVDPSRAGTVGSEYYVRFGGRRRFLDQHLAAGTSRESRFCMRIYYFWDEVRKQVVVGSAPKHLSNRFT